MGKNKEEGVVKIINYSVDKIKLEFKFVRCADIQFLYDNLMDSARNDFKYYESKLVTSCRDNFNFELGGNVMYIGIHPNWARETFKDCTSVIVEYNPNKIRLHDFKDFSILTTRPMSSVKVMRHDIAIDYPIDYNTLRLLKRHPNEYINTFGNSNTETVYLGRKKDNPCPVKFYNKAIEQKIDVNWSRLEFTVKNVNTFYKLKEKDYIDKIKAPQLYEVKKQLDTQSLKLTGVNRLAFEYILTDINTIYTLDYKIRKKFMQYLKEYLLPVEIDLKMMYRSFCQIANNL